MIFLKSDYMEYKPSGSKVYERYAETVRKKSIEENAGGTHQEMSDVNGLTLLSYVILFPLSTP